MPAGWDSWRSTGYWVDPADIQRLMAVISQIGVWQAGQRFAWRGQSDSDWPLSSSLQRAPFTLDDGEVRRREEMTLKDARAWGLGASRFGPIDDLQLLADLQHHGVPTHLVDVTSNPMTALWFACVHNTDRDGLLLAINTTDWPEVAPGEAPSTWGDVGDPSHRTRTTRLHSLSSGNPYVLRVPDPNIRMAAQEGYFLTGQLPSITNYESPISAFTIGFGPRAEGPLDFLKNPLLTGSDHLPFVAVKVRADLKCQLVGPLATTFNRMAGVLFPDYMGFRDWSTQLTGRQ